MASSALRRAMIQVAGERDIGSQETAHMLLGKPLYSCTYSFLCVSLDGSRRVRTGDEDDENRGDQALDPSVLEHYATRANWQENNPEILNLNLVQFASAYYVTKRKLKHRKQEVIIRTFPIFSPNPSGKDYGNYCKYALVKYKPWPREVNTAWDGLDDCHENHTQCYHAFLSSESAAHYIPMLQQELEQACRYNGHVDEDDNSDDDDEEVPQREGVPEEWMLLYRVNQRYDETISQGSQSHENLQFDWTETARAMPPALLRESVNWITKHRNEALEDPSVLNRRQQQTVDPARLNRQQMLAYNILASHHAALNGATPPEPLQVIITGTAGSGKSYLINAIKALLGDTCILKATAGLAGYNIEGCTLHSALQLPVRNHNNNDLKGTALQRLQLRFSGKQYLITDEMSMLGQRTLAWVDKRLRQATGKLHEPLGGISVKLLGDFRSYYLSVISLFMPPHPNPVLYSHRMDIPFMVYFKRWLCYQRIFDRLETIQRQKNFE